ncbi:MAG: T9SS type A sorting domain-containing protein [Saprospiraceae bacterium]
MIRTVLSLLALLAGSVLWGQSVPKNIVVEHFTNTRCGICANRNPGFYNNLNSQEGVLHVSIHPSSPYPSCVLHQANPTENNARTNYHGVFGGTPRLVINGEAIPSGANYGAASIFTPYQNQTTPISMRFWQTKDGNQINVWLSIKAVDTHSTAQAKLFLAAVEKLVNYDAPNGEDEHHDVFRKTFNDAPQGMTIDLPTTAGDSIVVEASLLADAGWAMDQLYALAILNDSDTRAVIQTVASQPADNTPLVVTNVGEALETPVSLFPNPVQDVINIQLPEVEGIVIGQLFDLQGRQLAQRTWQQHIQWDMSDLPQGTYLLLIAAEGKSAWQRIVKQ